MHSFDFYMNTVWHVGTKHLKDRSKNFANGGITAQPSNFSSKFLLAEWVDCLIEILAKIKHVYMTCVSHLRRRSGHFSRERNDTPKKGFPTPFPKLLFFADCAGSFRATGHEWDDRGLPAQSAKGKTRFDGGFGNRLSSKRGFPTTSNKTVIHPGNRPVTQSWSGTGIFPFACAGAARMGS